jgi:hypothetical protein
MSLPIKPPVKLNEEQREAAEEAGILDFLLGKDPKPPEEKSSRADT